MNILPNPKEAFENYLKRNLSERVEMTAIPQYLGSLKTQSEKIEHGLIPSPTWKKEEIIPYIVREWNEPIIYEDNKEKTYE
jgi:hypothetical protein